MRASHASVPDTIAETTIRKVQSRIIPILMVLMVIALLDRMNIGFAALTMNSELGITSEEYGLLAGVFFIGYFIFEIPSNLLLHKIGARVWLARILITWGIVAMLTGLARTAGHVYVLRFLLGVAEAGYFPGIVLYLTYWIRQKQLAQMLALFITASPIANMLGGSISGMILDHVHWLGLSSWRWLLILEGAPAIVGGILTYFLLPARPADANFLTAREKDWIAEELAHEEREKTAPGRISTSQTLTNGRVWHLTIIYFMAMISWNGLSLWMPQMMKAISAQFSNTTVGLLVMIPFFSAVVVMIFVARSSDRTLERRYHVVVPLFFGGIALTLLAARTANSVPVIVVLWCVGAAGTCSIWGPFWALPNEFLTGYSAAAGIAMINSIGNLGGFFGSYTIGALSRRSGSYGSALAFLAASLFAGAILMVALPKGRGQISSATET